MPAFRNLRSIWSENTNWKTSEVNYSLTSSCTPFLSISKHSGFKPHHSALFCPEGNHCLIQCIHAVYATHWVITCHCFSYPPLQSCSSVFKWLLLNSIMLPKPDSNDNGNFIKVYCYKFSILLLIIINLLLCLIYKLNFIINMYVSEKKIFYTGFSSIQASTGDLETFPLG
jgi:hypothetical protein